MEGHLGKTIERVRKQKNLSIKGLVEGIMTPSTYHRFKNGDIDTSITKFNGLLTRLNLRYEEFFFIHSRYQNDQIKESLLQLESLFNQKEIGGITRFQEQVAEERWSNPVAQQHLLSLANLLKDCLLHRESELENNGLLRYLEQTETWTHYEVAMFNNCMKAIPSSSIDFFLGSVSRSFPAYRTTTEYSHEISRIVTNAIISFLSRKEVRLARKWYTYLSTQAIGDHFLFERFFSKLLGQYLAFAEGNEKCKESFPRFVEYLEFMECGHLAQSITNMNRWMIENYDSQPLNNT